MTAAPAWAPPTEPAPRLKRWRRSLLWTILVGLLVVAQTLLVGLTLRYESARAQEAVDRVAAGVVHDLKETLRRNRHAMQTLAWHADAEASWQVGAAHLLRERRELLRLERRGLDLRVRESAHSPFARPLIESWARTRLEWETSLACAAAKRQGGAVYSTTHFVPATGGTGQEVMDMCIPIAQNGRDIGFLVGSISLPKLLEEAVPSAVAREHELSFIEGDGTRLARAGVGRGVGVFRADGLLDLTGITLKLRVDSASGRPQIIPNVLTALVLALSIAFAAVVVLLVRDVRRRAQAEAALAESLAFRKAMEDSLVTGLRARDLQGRITYVNPAFCEMVGYLPHELLGQTQPPYWPPELVHDYLVRQQMHFAASGGREGFEIVFVRRSGERFQALVFEAPLVDRHGHQTGWMSAVLDISQQRRVEELSRQQQERLQATARLATMGEMASLLSHELNQPLAAISSYATGSLNLLAHDEGGTSPAAITPETQTLLHEALQRMAEQAARAGRVIQSVHDFVRRRDQSRELLSADQLVQAVLPLVSLQARKNSCRLSLDMPSPAPLLVCDRTMVEQVLLNLTRNGIQAMEHTPVADRELRLVVKPASPGCVSFSVLDRGPGITDEVAAKLFTPFFTTRNEGMGLGLSLCRTVAEQHGGSLQFNNLHSPLGVCGAEFRFTLCTSQAELAQHTLAAAVAPASGRTASSGARAALAAALPAPASPLATTPPPP